MPAEQDALFPGKQFISTVLEALETKTRMTGVIAHRYLMRAAMAGMIVAVFYIVNYAIVGVCDGLRIGDTSLAGFGKMLGALSFGPALVFIYYTKSELLTSNMMVVAIGHYYKRISTWRALRVLVMCLAGNFAGGLVFAAMYRFSTLVEAATAEQAVHREIAEEAGLRIAALRYLGSQPWPMPRSLMLSFVARSDSVGRVDGLELSWGGWYRRDEVNRLVDGGSLVLPPGASVGHRLIEAWLDGRLPLPEP